MKETEWLALIILVVIVVLFILYVRDLRSRKRVVDIWEEDDSCVPKSCDDNCLRRWFHTFDLGFEEQSASFSEVNTCLAIQPDGKVIVGSNIPFPLLGFIKRYNTDGTQDMTFGPPALPPGVSGYWTMIEIAPDGSIFVTGEGRYSVNNWYAMIVVKLTPLGQLDLSFGSGLGYWIDSRTSDPNVVSLSWSLKLLGNGQILVGGFQITALGDNITVLARLNADGTTDTSFGTLGFTTHGFFGEIRGIGIQSDGKILGGGQIADVTLTTGLGAVRFTSNGTLDLTYNGTGFNFDNNNNLYGNEGRGFCAIMINDEMLVGGYTNGPLGALASIVKFTKTGALDPGWAVGGRFIQEPGPITNNSSVVMSLFSTCDGGCFAGGFTRYAIEPFDPSNVSTFLYKLNANGSLNPDFRNGANIILRAPPSTCNQIYHDGDKLLYYVGQIPFVTAIGKIVLSEN